MQSINILGLMDIKYTGKYIYGKKVLSEDEIQLLGVDTIIIAAEPYSAEIVYKRISAFCISKHITILDMYGCDEQELHRNILEQELAYAEMDGKVLREDIARSDVLFVSFCDVLCPEISLGEGKICENVSGRIGQKGLTISGFDRCQKWTPRTEGIDLLKYAIVRGKKVYIYSNLTDGEQVISSFLHQNGIFQYEIVAAEADMLAVLLGRLVRALGEEYGFQRVLCLGDDKEADLIIPQLYGARFRMIQGSLRMFFKATKLRIDQNTIGHSLQRDNILKDILEAFQPFSYGQIDVASVDRMITEKVEWDENREKSHVEIFPLKYADSLEDIEKITFPKMKQPMVSIIIPAFNQFEYTYNCLKAILVNTENVSYEVIVADDCSSDFTSQIEQIVSSVTVIHNERNMVFIKNCNNAAKFARGKYIVFLNNDTQVQHNWLYPLVACMETEKDVGLAGSKLLYPDGSLQEAGGIIWNNGEAWNYGRGKNPDLPAYNYVREVDYISGASIIIAKALWDEIGGFDERYVPAYCEDSDLAYEVRKRGKQVLYQPDSVVVHFEGISNGKSIESGVRKYQRENQIKFLKKWGKVLEEEQYFIGKHVLAASDRKRGRKTVLFISEQVPMYDKDTESWTLDLYIREFVKKGYIVKFIPDNFIAQEPYTHRLEQMGVEVLSGQHYQKTVMDWICTNSVDIDYAFLISPNVSIKYVDVLKKFKIPVMYYGIELYYLRMQRESKLCGDSEKARETEMYYDKEAYIIQNCDAVFYSSLDDVRIAKKEFCKENIRQLMANFYDTETIRNQYEPQKREGILFSGGYWQSESIDAVMWFVHQVYPVIYRQEKIPFYIAGVGMPAEIIGIAEEGIIVLESVTNLELEELYGRAKIVIIPLRHRNDVKDKVIEALYHGVPVVSTSIGMEGVPNENYAVKIADEENDFAGTIIECCRSDKELMRMSAEGQKIIKRYYSADVAWSKIADDFS